MQKSPLWLTASLLAALATPAYAVQKPDPEALANVTVEQVRAALAGDKNLSGKSLMDLDLSNMDLSGANLSGANLHGTKLDHANLSKADLRDANLDLSWLIGANFTDANLRDASLDGPVVAMGLTAEKGEIPTFRGADMSGARVLIRATGGNLQGAKFVGADAGAHMNNQSMGLMHSDLSGAHLEGADFSNAKLQHADFSYADLQNVNFKGADLERAALTGADLSGANLTGANLDGAELDDAKMGGVIGLDQAKNLDKARGYKKPS